MWTEISILLFLVSGPCIQGGRICEPGLKICSNELFTKCYNETTQICWGGVICNRGQKGCGFECYDPSEKVCFPNALCDIGLEACGRDCYDPKASTKKCIDYQWGDILCEANQTNCQRGFGEMYCC